MRVTTRVTWQSTRALQRLGRHGTLELGSLHVQQRHCHTHARPVDLSTYVHAYAASAAMLRLSRHAAALQKLTASRWCACEGMTPDLRQRHTSGHINMGATAAPSQNMEDICFRARAPAPSPPLAECQRRTPAGCPLRRGPGLCRTIETPTSLARTAPVPPPDPDSGPNTI